ncbi:MAG TPA: hypothetical protein VIH76_01420 [Candidatus Acidoferrales bacterium]
MSTQQGKCTDWKAWHDREPGGPPTLHVTGKCEFPTGGYKVELKPAKPQGINPKIYILEKFVHPPTGRAYDKVTDIEVEYVEKTSTLYNEVLIVPDQTTVPVKEVS